MRCDVQRLGAPAGRAARHALRDQEREFDPLRHAGDRVRGAPPDRGDRGGRHDRAGDAAVRFRPRRDPADALARKTRTTTAISPIPICCRWCSTRPGSSGCKPTCRNCPTPRRRASSRDYGLSAYDAGVLVAEQETAAFLRDGRQGPRRQARRQLGDLRSVRRAQQGRASTSPHSPVSAEALGGLIDLIADNTISGRIAKDVFAEMVETGKAGRGDRRGEGPAPGHRHRRHRSRDRRGAGASMPTRSPNTARARTSCSASSSAR